MTPQSASRRIHWVAPATIVVAFIAAMAFAIGHHAFYTHLDGKPADSGDRLFDQQINIAIGTAFAFIVRAALTIAVGAAYWQLFWQTLLRQRKPLAVTQVDALAGVLGSLFDFANVRALVRSPVLAAVALLSWLVPLAALLPPATLSVETTRRLEHDLLQVPTLNFSAMTEGQEWKANAQDMHPLWIATEALPSLIHLGNTTALQARILGNMTYEIQFPGSALQCEGIVNDDLGRMRKFLNDDCNVYTGQPAPGGRPCGFSNTRVLYYSWVPNSTEWNSTQRLDTDSLDLKNYGGVPLSKIRFGWPQLYVASKSNYLDGDPVRAGDWDVLNCSLHHATYTATVLSTSDRIFVANYSVETHDSLVPQASTHSQATHETYLRSNATASDLGNLALMSSISETLLGHVRSDETYRLLKGFSGLTGTTLIYTREFLYNTVIIPSVSSETPTWHAPARLIAALKLSCSIDRRVPAKEAP